MSAGSTVEGHDRMKSGATCRQIADWLKSRPEQEKKREWTGTHIVLLYCALFTTKLIHPFPHTFIQHLITLIEALGKHTTSVSCTRMLQHAARDWTMNHLADRWPVLPPEPLPPPLSFLLFGRFWMCIRRIMWMPSQRNRRIASSQ